MRWFFKTKLGHFVFNMTLLTIIFGFIATFLHLSFLLMMVSGGLITALFAVTDTNDKWI
jgi:uncharacterized membrane protein